MPKTPKYSMKAFPKEDLLELAYYGEVEGMTVISNKLSHTSRWSEHWELIFKAGVVYYQVDYQKGATEMQDEQPFEYEPDMVDCIEVRPVEILTTVYQPVEV